MRAHRRLLWTAPALLFVLAACGQTPEDTEKARGVLAGVPFALAMSVIFVVLAVGAIGIAVMLDRAVRARQRLAEEPRPEEEPEEEPDEVVAGITVRRAPVPRWLYAAYVLIPLFAMAYVVSNVAVAPAQQAEETPAPEEGPCTECTIVAQQIKFTISELEVKAGEEITVTFDNQDTGVPHDFTTWPDKAAADANEGEISTTGTVAGGSTGETTFPADDATFFNCTIHPASMFGDIVAS